MSLGVEKIPKSVKERKFSRSCVRFSNLLADDIAAGKGAGVRTLLVR